MKKPILLITGAVANSDENDIQTYKKLVEMCGKYNCEISSPLETMKFKGTDSERYIRAMELVQNAKLVIAEMSTPSVGQGMELQKAIDLDVPIIIIVKKGKTVSKMILGSKVNKVIFYNDTKDLEEKLEMVLKEVI